MTRHAVWCGDIVTYMYLRESRQKRADGTLITYLQRVESVWNPVKQRSEICWISVWQIRGPLENTPAPKFAS